MAAGLWLLSLLHPPALPLLRSLESLPVLPAPGGEARRAPAHRKGGLLKPLGHTLLAPLEVPTEIPNLPETGVSPPWGVLGGNGAEADPGSKNLGNLLSEGLGAGTGPSLAPPSPPSSNHPPRVSHSMEGHLIHQVQPEYPPLARQARVQGTVLLRAVIDGEGKIENLQVLSGHPLLVASAVKAVQQWRYRPYYLNEQPVEVETEITVHFTLSGG